MHVEESSPAPVAAPPAEDFELEAAREVAYRFLAAVFADPRKSDWSALVLDRTHQELAAAACDVLRECNADSQVELGLGEAPVAALDLRPLIDALRRADLDLEAEYVRVFGLAYSRECPPYETEYQRIEDTFFRGQQMADIAGFYRAFGVQPGGLLRERPDHAALELEFAALLVHRRRTAWQNSPDDDTAAERSRICEQALAAFLREHLCWWLPALLRAIQHQSPQGPFACAAQVLAALLPIERARFGIAAPSPGVQPSIAIEPDDCEECGLSEDIYELGMPTAPRGAGCQPR